MLCIAVLIRLYGMVALFVRCVLEFGRLPVRVYDILSSSTPGDVFLQYRSFPTLEAMTDRTL